MDVDSAGNVTASGLSLNQRYAPMKRPALGGQRGGFHYQPDPAYDSPAMRDYMVIVLGSAGLYVPVGYYASANPADDVALPGALLPGEAIIAHKSGSAIKMHNDGSITIAPASGKTVNIGTAAAASARVGDAVSVSLSTGNGTITASSSNVRT